MNEIEIYIQQLKQHRDALEVQLSKVAAENGQLRAENEQLKKALWESRSPAEARDEESKAPETRSETGPGEQG